MTARSSTSTSSWSAPGLSGICAGHYLQDETPWASYAIFEARAANIQRALDRMPQQGSKFPWQVYQSYLQDHRATRRTSIDDGVMHFTNPGGEERTSLVAAR